MRSYDPGADGEPDYIRDETQDGDPIAISRIDEDSLRAVASQLGVPYEHRTTPDSTERLAEDIDVQAITQDGREVSLTYSDLYWIFAFALLPLLLWEIWDTLRRATPRPTREQRAEARARSKEKRAAAKEDRAQRRQQKATTKTTPYTMPGPFGRPPSGPQAHAGQYTPPPGPYGQAPYGQAPGGPSPYGQGPGPSPYGQAPYGQAPGGQAPYGQAPHGQAPGGRSVPGGQMPTAPGPYGSGATWAPPAAPGHPTTGNEGQR